jgi:hypothetical protein
MHVFLCVDDEVADEEAACPVPDDADEEEVLDELSVTVR